MYRIIIYSVVFWRNGIFPNEIRKYIANKFFFIFSDRGLAQATNERLFVNKRSRLGKQGSGGAGEIAKSLKVDLARR